MRSRRRVLPLAGAVLALSLSSSVSTPQGEGRALAAGLVLANPILFVTQVPVPADFTTIAAVFGNHLGDLDLVARGGDLWIRYPEGGLKNLTQAAGYGMTGFQGARAIAVREPSVYWDGSKAVFSMLVGAPTEQYQYDTYYWQLYEIAGLEPTDTPVIAKVPGQPSSHNNVSPIYGTDDRIIFTSDRPRSGEAHLYPQLDEYEEAPSTTGLWSLDPSTGDLFLMEHSPSGSFTPILDNFGRVVFTRWDHLVRDQQADDDATGGGDYGTFNYADESAGAARLNDRSEVYPEPHPSRTDLLAGTPLAGLSFNHFFPWQINEDGTEEETLNHVGRHELHDYFDRSVTDDPNVEEFYASLAPVRRNPNPIDNLLQLAEDPLSLGVYFGTDAPEFYTQAAGQIISLDAPPSLSADLIRVTYITHRDTHTTTANPGATHSGHYRNPLPLSDGTLAAIHTPETREDRNEGTRAHPRSRYDFRLKTLIRLPNGYWTADQPLTSGIAKPVTYWDPDVLVTYDGQLWELDPVEVRVRARPPRRVPSLEAPELEILAQEDVPLSKLTSYLVQNDMALLVSRDVTTRDEADLQQPFNLRVVGTATHTVGSSGTVYDVARLQFFQADQIRGIGGTASPDPGRRVLAQPLHTPGLPNPPSGSSGPPGSVALGSDGSMAAFVPARRALSWQLTDAAGTGVVRERYWLSFQPGEIRVCASCHGLNQRDQAGKSTPANPPEALATLLRYWKQSTGGL